ncbi:acetylxylan esterase [Mycetocola miduiensis]|uniref:Cephalosporin-C deacetylase n=1 Tax=Mycetocola miduiensis TaxID=995034 RepID=A0A1I5C8A8_9MICO|nr:acetylxylan esterase [Mycetocola miduiensis]SFN83157.1 cephalosporin-C deacetylase [Mycetocola miduiensis]
MYTDLPEGELRQYRSAQTDPTDFDDFWARTLEGSRVHDLGVKLEQVDSRLVTIDLYDVTFAGFDGHPVKAWLRVPAGTVASGRSLPTVVQFVGYGGGRGHEFENLLWASAGYAHLIMDTRGQGSGWSTGSTPDPVGSGPATSGVMTRGIESPESYYYRRVYTDAVRAVEAARSLPVVDGARLAVLGGSQGGGIALAVSALVPDVAALVAYVPFLCDFPRATVITDRDPYKEIGRYLAVHREASAAVHETLSYFDGVNFARRASAPAWFSAALMDPTCPPSTVFGAYHEYAGPKEIAVWPYNGHEGGGVLDEVMATEALAGMLR